MSITVVLADDHPMSRSGIRTALEEATEIEIVGEARDAAEVKPLVARLHPDILLLDLIMPGPPPRQIARWVRTHHLETKTLVLTAHDRAMLLAAMEEAGAVGYLTKDENFSALVEAIRRAARGEVLYTQKQRDRAHRWREEVGKRWESLTEREREVLALMVKGQTNREIAQTLSVTEKTIEKHVSGLLEKLDVSSRTEAAVWIIRNELLE